MRAEPGWTWTNGGGEHCLAVQPGAAPQQPGWVGVCDAASPGETSEYEGKLALLARHGQTGLALLLLLQPGILPVLPEGDDVLAQAGRHQAQEDRW